jgi:Calcineurin-like phosphoesterase
LPKSLAQDPQNPGRSLPRPCLVNTLIPMIKRIFVALIVVSSMTLSPPSLSSEWTFKNVDRVVAISDVHGAYEAMVRTLKNADLIADDLTWCGGTSHLVIVGDLLDRGPNSRDAMDLLMRLEGEARAAGGQVHVVVGNHEVMNLNGDLRYVSVEEYAAFAEEETEQERQQSFDAYVERAGVDEASLAATRAEFDTRFPPGYFAHRRAFASDGVYGNWLLGKPVIVVVNGTAFVHGGLPPLVADVGLEGVNGKLMLDLLGYVRAVEYLTEAGELLRIDNFKNRDQILDGFVPGLNTSAETAAAVEAVAILGESDLHNSDGPTWYRGNVSCSRLIEEDRLMASLEAIGADRVVIGHTPTPGRRILQRMNGRVFEVDTGMLNNYYSGLGNALILEGDTVATINENSKEIVSPEEHPRRVGARPGGAMSAADLERLLLTGDIVATRDGVSGRRFVQISDGTRDVEALFSKREARGFYADVAAYRLDRLLELEMVPVAVVREVDGTDGSLQFLPNQWLDEKQRGASGGGGSAQCPLTEQWPAMYVFDTLIYNEGRSLRRMLYSRDIWQLILVGHNRAFSTSKGKPSHLAIVPLAIGDAWVNALASLTDEMLEEKLGDVLDKRRRRALLARRDQLIE